MSSDRVKEQIHSSGWIGELEKQLRRSRHVILHGNVRDKVLLNDKFVDFEEALDRALEACGYQARASYNPVDGITYKPDGARKDFDSKTGTGKAGPVTPGKGPVEGGVAETRTGFEDILPLLRQALRENLRLSCAVIYFADSLFSAEGHGSAAERGLMVHLSLIAAEARAQRFGELTGLCNALILVAPSLGAIPSWLYKNNPYFSLVQVGTPEAREREKYFALNFNEFYQDPPLEEPNDKLIEEFVALTEGLSYHDLESIRLTSDYSKLKLQEPLRLIDFYKYGKRDDYWEKLDIGEARNKLNKEVMGQDSAIEAVHKILVSARGGISVEPAGKRAVRPKRALFFVGPTGVGKTEMAKAITEFIFKDPTAYGRFDMSEYHEEHSATRLVGAPPSYVGYDEGGQLTNWMSLHPFSVVLFDEIEKAHSSIMDKFLQILEDGRLTDGMGKTVYFSQSLIIFTSNIGATQAVLDDAGKPICDHEGKAIRVPAIDQGMSYEQIKNRFKNAVRDHFTQINRKEILGRIGDENIIVFDMMRSQNIQPVLFKFLRIVAENVKEKYNGLKLVFDNGLVEQCQLYCQKPECIEAGYRSIRDFVEFHIVPPLNERVIRKEKLPAVLKVYADRDGKIIVADAG